MENNPTPGEAAQPEPAIVPAKTAADGSQELVREWRPSWFAYPKSLAVMLLAPVVGFLVGWFFLGQEDVKTAAQIADGALAALVGLGGLTFPVYVGVNLARRSNRLMLFRNGLVRHRKGLISRDSTDIQAEDIRSLDIRQTILQRILRIGDVTFDTAAQSQGDEISFTSVRRPDEIRAAVNRYRDNDPSND